MTAAERLLWAMLRGRQLGAKFRRQHPIGPFFADFFCVEARLVIELDGPIHRQRRRHDCRRDVWLVACGLRVLRLSNDKVLRHPKQAVAEIQRSLFAADSAPLTPLSPGRGGRGVRVTAAKGDRPASSTG